MSMNYLKKIGVILVTYNRSELLIEVLNSVLNQTYKVSYVFVVDNNSNDNTFEKLFEKKLVSNNFESYDDIGKFSENTINNLKIFYLRLFENLGGAGGFHYGVEFSLKYDWDFLWFLDDDAKPENDCLENLMKYSDMNRVLIPLRFSYEIDIREFPAIRFNMRNPFLREVRELDFYRNFESYKDFPDTIEVEDFSFEGPLIKREFILKIGLPKEDIFISGDDTDYALRILKQFGVKHLLIKDAVIKRLDSENKLKDIPLWKEYYLKRNYYYTHYKYSENIFVKIKPFFLFVLSILKNVLLFRMSYKRLKVNYFAFIDSFKEKMPGRYKPDDFN